MAETDSAKVSEHVEKVETRRDFLQLATGAFAAVGGAAVAWPFIQQMNPAADTLALATVEVDISAGKKEFTVYTMDLTKDYIEINADYRS